MQFKLITGADAKSFEDNVNKHIAELDAAGGRSISIFQPFSTDHAERFCVAIVSRDLVAEQAAHQARVDAAAKDAADVASRFRLTPVEPTNGEKGANEEHVEQGLREHGIEVVAEHVPTPQPPTTPYPEPVAAEPAAT